MLFVHPNENCRLADEQFSPRFVYIFVVVWRITRKTFFHIYPIPARVANYKEKSYWIYSLFSMSYFVLIHTHVRTFGPLRCARAHQFTVDYVCVGLCFFFFFLIAVQFPSRTREPWKTRLEMFAHTTESTVFSISPGRVIIATHDHRARVTPLARFFFIHPAREQLYLICLHRARRTRNTCDYRNTWLR